MQLKLLAEVSEMLKWLPPSISLPMEPLKWVDEWKSERLIVAVGNNEGRERGKKIASFHFGLKSSASMRLKVLKYLIEMSIRSLAQASTIEMVELSAFVVGRYFHNHAKGRQILFTLPRTVSDTMVDNHRNNMDPHTQAAKYAYYNIINNKYYFTFEARGYPEEEQFGHLGFVKPYFTEFNPARPLGRPLNHTEDPATLLPIPKLLPANCLDEDQYPWNILCSGPHSCDWDYQRHSLYEELNVGAYKTQRTSIPVHQDPSATQSAMSTVTGTALQTSYP